MGTHSRVWSDTSPSSSANARLGAQDIRQARDDIQDRMRVEHWFDNGTSTDYAAGSEDIDTYTDASGRHLQSAARIDQSMTHATIIANADEPIGKLVTPSDKGGIYRSDALCYHMVVPRMHVCRDTTNQNLAVAYTFINFNSGSDEIKIWCYPNQTIKFDIRVQVFLATAGFVRFGIYENALVCTSDHVSAYCGAGGVAYDASGVCYDQPIANGDDPAEKTFKLKVKAGRAVTSGIEEVVVLITHWRDGTTA